MRRTIIFLFILISNISQAQYTQTIRGVVIDKTTQITLPGANVSLNGGDKTIGTTTNERGEFEFNNINIGKHHLMVSFMGYEPCNLYNLELNAGKEKVLTVELSEQIQNVAEVLVTSIKKGDTHNKMATLSARSFSVKETERYAGSLGDPSRMASNFAGVITANDSRNDIIIRGNSPQGLLWRLEGINIPNPNHYGALGSTGGPVGMLNNNVLSNSDFFTGAFPAEYGNALSGVFDLKMRNGNNKKHEFTGQIGFNGFELGAEGPISKHAGSSYMINYRYSVLSVMDKLGFDVAGGAVPIYQDITFKLNMPTKKLGTFSIFGIAGDSEIEFADTGEDSGSTYNTSSDARTRNGSQMGVIGLTHRLFTSKRSNLFTTLSASYQAVATQIDSTFENLPDKRFYGEGNKETRLTASTRYTFKINTKNTFKSGVTLESFGIDYQDSITGEVYEPIVAGYVKQLSTNKNGLMLAKAFGEWQHRFGNRLTIYGGLYSQYFLYNSTYAIDPRLSISYKLNESGKISIAYGKHAQLQPFYIYFTETYNRDKNTYEQTNTKLDFSKANHYVAAYDQFLGKNLKLKIETYFQDLYDIPVKNTESYFSMVNAGSTFHQDRVNNLVNNGLAKNYGAELTLEKYLDNNYYFLITGSLFESKYLPSDGIWRNTEFNSNFVLNALGGYEIPLNETMSIDINLRTIWSGGKRNLYIDLVQSKQEGYEVYDHTKAYAEREKDYFKFDGRISFKMNGKHYTQEWALDVTNITNRKNVYTKSYNNTTKAIEYIYQQGRYPMFLYRINF